MPKIEKVGVNLGLTMNLGNYESARLDAHVELSPEDGDTAESLFKESWRIVREELRAQAKAVRSKNNAKEIAGDTDE